MGEGWQKQVGGCRVLKGVLFDHKRYTQGDNLNHGLSRNIPKKDVPILGLAWEMRRLIMHELVTGWFLLIEERKDYACSSMVDVNRHE